MKGFAELGGSLKGRQDMAAGGKESGSSNDGNNAESDEFASGDEGTTQGSPREINKTDVTITFGGERMNTPRRMSEKSSKRPDKPLFVPTKRRSASTEIDLKSLGDGYDDLPEPQASDDDGDYDFKEPREGRMQTEYLFLKKKEEKMNFLSGRYAGGE